MRLSILVEHCLIDCLLTFWLIFRIIYIAKPSCDDVFCEVVYALEFMAETVEERIPSQVFSSFIFKLHMKIPKDWLAIQL